MGFNTAVMVLNDQMDQIENDPQFSKKLCNAIREKYGKPDNDLYCGSFSVLASQHADWDQLVIVGGNTIRTFKELTKEEAKRALRNAAWEAGLKVSIRDGK